MTALVHRFVALLMLAAGAMGAPPTTAADRQGTPVGVGDTAPDFTLEDQEGRRHTLSAERGKRPVVLVFYRGHW